MQKFTIMASCAIASSFLMAPVAVKAHDWADYGPLKVNIRGWTLNKTRLTKTGETTYDTNFINTRKNREGLISVNCDRNRLATTDSKGKWRKYRASARKNEKDLKNDFCTAIRKNPSLFSD